MATQHTTTTARDDDRLLTTQDVAVLLQVPAETVKAWRARRTGPRYLRVGKHIRYTAAAVNAYMRACEVVR